MLTEAYKSKIIKFKLDEDPLRSRIYFLTFIESLEMIISQFKENCESLLDYPKIRGEDKNILLERKLGIFCIKTLMYILEG